MITECAGKLGSSTTYWHAELHRLTVKNTAVHLIGDDLNFEESAKVQHRLARILRLQPSRAPSGYSGNDSSHVHCCQRLITAIAHLPHPCRVPCILLQTHVVEPSVVVHGGAGHLCIVLETPLAYDHVLQEPMSTSSKACRLVLSTPKAGQHGAAHVKHTLHPAGPRAAAQNNQDMLILSPWAVVGTSVALAAVQAGHLACKMLATGARQR